MTNASAKLVDFRMAVLIHVLFLGVVRFKEAAAVELVNVDVLKT
jgi:hypothetical protein